MTLISDENIRVTILKCPVYELDFTDLFVPKQPGTKKPLAIINRGTSAMITLMYIFMYIGYFILFQLLFIMDAITVSSTTILTV